MVGSHIYQNESVDYHRLLAIGALFNGVFSIDWLLDLLAEKKPSQILAQLEEGVKEGSLIKKGPGHYSFADEKKQEKWRPYLSEGEQRELHQSIADILMQELPDTEQKAHAVAHHLMHTSNDPGKCRYLIEAGDLHLKAFRTEDARRGGRSPVQRNGYQILEDLHSKT
ncbi:MAG: hypothetical protein AMK69_06470 [Nitrospira bacterium SG8_3]|nr:MAG: hypothetical protein AMK69_06470 [Nitrospira bacterium SG8_3]